MSKRRTKPLALLVPKTQGSKTIGLWFLSCPSTASSTPHMSTMPSRSSPQPGVQPGAAPAFSLSLGVPPLNSTNSILQNWLNAPTLFLGDQLALGIWNRGVPHPEGPLCYLHSLTVLILSPSSLRTNDRRMHIHTHTCKYVRIRIHVCMYMHVYHSDPWKKTEVPFPDLASLPPQSTPSIWLWQRVKKNKHVCTNKTGHLIPVPCINQLAGHFWDLNIPKTCNSNSYGLNH